MKARITLVTPPRIESNPLLMLPEACADERELVEFDLDVTCLQEAQEYYHQAVVMDFPCVRGLLLRSIEEIKS